jgi:hypothetical protein
MGLQILHLLPQNWRTYSRTIEIYFVSSKEFLIRKYQHCVIIIIIIIIIITSTLDAYLKDSFTEIQSRYAKVKFIGIEPMEM